MPHLNKIEIMGHLGSEPEMRFTPSGSPVTSFPVAVDNYFMKDGKREQETEWFTVVTWNKLAEATNQRLNKGHLVYVEGRLHTHKWDGQDGQKHSRNEIIARSCIFLTPNSQDKEPPEDEIDEGDLPF